jgi:DNA-binding ferritin-like protein
MKPAQMQTINHNQRYANTRTYPELVKPSKAAEQEATYYAALELVAQIDEDLTRGVRHYRNKAGVLLTTLDEVVRAIIDNNLLIPEEQEADVVWMRPQELAA